MSARKRTAVLISGNGSNLQALIDATGDPAFPARIELVLSNKADAYGIERAKKANIETHIISHRDFSSRETFDDAMHTVLTDHGIQLVCLAGFMRLLTPGFVEKWYGRMINIHPSLLPAFKGLDTHRRVIEEGVRFSGCTVHFVVPEMDAGPIIIQAAVPVNAQDTPDGLSRRIHVAEHRIYPEALRLLACGALRLNGQRVEGIANAEDKALFNPPLSG